MSYTEINAEKGMPYGGMPHDEILLKLEATDPRLVDTIRPRESLHDPEDDYDNYIREEIVDFGPDATFLESDHPRRDPALSRSIVNSRYSGGRGANDYRAPQHPEMFIGFTGNDPRGADNQPRMDQARSQMNSRSFQHVARMGKNVGHGGSDASMVADRPWGGVAMEYDKKELYRRVKGKSNWVPAQKVSRPWGSNTVADSYAAVQERTRAVKEGDESIDVYNTSMLEDSGYDPVRGETGGKVRSKDTRRANSAPWNNTEASSDLAVHKYVSRAPGGKEQLSMGAVGGALASRTDGDVQFTSSALGKTTNRKVLAASMGASAARRRAQVRAEGGDVTHGQSRETKAPGSTAPKLGTDITKLVHQSTGSQPAARVWDHSSRYAAGVGVGTGPNSDRQRILYHTKHSSPSASRFSNITATARSLRDGTSSKLRSVQNYTQGTSLLGGTPEGFSVPRGVGAVPDNNLGTRKYAQSGGGVIRADVAEQEVYKYTSSRPSIYHHVEDARASGFSNASESRQGRREGVSGKPGFVNSSKAPHTLGADHNDTFGGEGETFASYSSIGGKNLRASTLKDGGDDVMDVDDGFSQGFDS
jgi:hypothetical protein